MSWSVTTTVSTVPSSEKIGVALIKTVTLRPSGELSTISSARTDSPVLSACASGYSASEISWPSARRKVSTSSSSSGPCPSVASPCTIRLASWLKDTSVPVPTLNTTTPTGEVLNQRLQVGPRALLLPVPAGVRDG